MGSDINNKLKRLPDEDLKQYKLRLFRNKIEYRIKTQGIADLINKENEQNYNESTYRKWFTAYDEGYQDAKTENITDDNLLQEYIEKENEIKLERAKLRTEKNESNRWIREDARYEMFFEQIEEALQKYRIPIKVPEKKIITDINHKDGITGFADVHYGAEWEVRGLEDELINKYNPEIFEERMWKLFNKIITSSEKENINHINLVNLSDTIDGILHISQLQSLRYGVIDSIVHFEDFITTWLNELSKYLSIDFYSSWGNHNQIRVLTGKKGDLPNENAEKLITHHLQCMLKDNPNINIHASKSNLSYFKVLDMNVLATHGDNEGNLDNSIKDYMLAYNKPIDLLLTGHLHSKHERGIGMNDKFDIEYVQYPSICGVDPYGMSKKKASKSGSKFLVVEENEGIVNTYNFKLN
jgi:predicted phosphodiesterase